MVDIRPSAIGLIQRNLLCGAESDLGALAARHGLHLAFTVEMDARPLVVGMAVARHVAEFHAVAVVVPGFEHADPVRHVVTAVAALVTPMAVYPKGFQWRAARAEGGSGDIRNADGVGTERVSVPSSPVREEKL